MGRRRWGRFGVEPHRPNSSTEAKRMMHLLLPVTLAPPLSGERRVGGLRYNEKAIAPGAQTERRGLAGPVRTLLGGEDSPADFVNCLLSNVRRFAFLNGPLPAP